MYDIYPEVHGYPYEKSLIYRVYERKCLTRQLFAIKVNYMKTVISELHEVRNGVATHDKINSWTPKHRADHLIYLAERDQFYQRLQRHVKDMRRRIVLERRVILDSCESLKIQALAEQMRGDIAQSIA